MPKPRIVVGATTAECLYLLLQVPVGHCQSNATRDAEDKENEEPRVHTLFKEFCETYAGPGAFCIYRSNCHTYEMHAHWPVAANDDLEAHDHLSYTVGVFFSKRAPTLRVHLYKQHWNRFLYPAHHVNGAGWWYLCRGPELGCLPDILYNSSHLTKADVLTYHYLWYNEPERAALLDAMPLGPRIL